MSASRSDGPEVIIRPCRPLLPTLCLLAWPLLQPPETSLRRALRNKRAVPVPVVFTIGGDPIRFGLIESINRPGGNVTGILFNPNVLGAKRIELVPGNDPHSLAGRAPDEPHQSECQN